MGIENEMKLFDIKSQGGFKGCPFHKGMPEGSLRYIRESTKFSTSHTEGGSSGRGSYRMELSSRKPWKNFDSMMKDIIKARDIIKKEDEYMDLYEAMEKRRTIRKFKNPATEEQLKRILSKGTLAPSPRNAQTWEFIVLDAPERIEAVSEIKYILNRGNKPRDEEVPREMEKAAKAQKESFANASLVVVFHAEGASHAAGAWCCIQNMLLAAVAEGLGGYAEKVEKPDDIVPAVQRAKKAIDSGQAALLEIITAEEPAFSLY